MAATPFRLHLFQNLQRSQASRDYAHYHTYCTARLARLRRNSPVKSFLVHNAKYVEGKSGRRNAYCSREQPPPTHPNVLWNLFVQAERAWAQACDKQSAKATKNPHSFVLRRLRKAAQWAERLLETAKDCCVAESILECQSYSTWMNANVALERKDYAAAFRNYSESMTILLQLADGNMDSTPDALIVRDIWTTRAESLIRPLARFCAHEAKDSLTEQEIQSVVASTKSSPTATASTMSITFRGNKIAIDSYQSLAVLYLKMESAKPDTEEQFLQLWTDLDDALQLVAAEYSHYESLPVGPAVTAKREELTALRQYFTYQKLSVWRVQQEHRLHDLTNDAEIVHIYDTLQQNAQATADLVTGNDVEDDPLWLEAQAHVIRIRALRCYHLARVYESTATATAAQILSLLRHAHKLGKRAVEEVAACDDMAQSDEYLNSLEVLEGQIRAMTCRVEATQYLESVGSSGTKITSRPLWLRYKDLDAGTVLADNPPLFIPMPYKPVFYDLAWQYLDGELPVDEIQEFIDQNVPKKGGLFSWFSS